MHRRTCRRISPLGALLALALAATPARAQIAGENVNMVSGTEWPGGDPFLQRQNEPTLAVSSANPSHLLAGANDYRSVDIPRSLPCDPAALDAAQYSACLKRYPVISDGWLGVFKSLDGGQTWKSTLLEGYPQDPHCLPKPANPAAADASRRRHHRHCRHPDDNLDPTPALCGLPAAADPVMRAGTDGMFYLAGLNFQRDKSASRIFLARFIDLNDSEAGSTTALRNDGAAEADSVRYLDTSVVAVNPPGMFLDKPWVAVDVPRTGALTCTLSTPNAAGVTVTRSFRGGTIYVGWTQFSLPDELTGDIMLSYSRDCGRTWAAPQKLNGKNSTLSQGVSLGIEPITGRVYAAWRRAASGRQGDAIMVTRSEGRSRHFSHARVLYAMTYPFDQPTNFGTFRSNAFPSLAISTDGNSSWAHVAWSQRQVAGGNSRVVVTTARVHPRPVGDDDPDDPEEQDDETRVRWSLPRPVDAAPIRATVGFDLLDGLVVNRVEKDFDGGHQFMPSLTFGQGRLVALYYDTRLDHTRRYYRPVDPAGNGGRFYDEVVAPVGEALEGAAGLARVYNDYVSDAVPNPDPSQPGFDPAKQLTQVRHTLDVRVATARIDGVFDFGPSALVSQFPFGLRGDEGNPVGTDGKPVKRADGSAEPMTVATYGAGGAVTYDATGNPTSRLTIVDEKGQLQLQQQLQHNPGGFPLFKNGQVAFMGDYIDIQGPSFVPVAGGWSFAWQYTDTPVFHAVWASNQDVRAPPPIYTPSQKNPAYTFSADDLARGWAVAVDPATGRLDYQHGFIDWSKYTPVRRLNGQSTFLLAADSALGGIADNQQAACVTGFEGSRDQNIYSARISEGLYVSSPQNVKPLPAGGAGAAGEARAFVVAARNPSARALQVAFSATDPAALAGTGRAVELSWTSAFTGPSELTAIEVPAFTTVHRTLFVRLASGSTNPYATANVKVAQTGCTSCQVGYVTLNPPVAMGQILSGAGLPIGNADTFGAQFIDARLTDPSWSNPSWSNGAPAPSWSNPSWSNSALAPSWSNPSWSNAGLTNVNFSAPSWSNPSWSNPSWSNPSWSNPSWSNPSWSNPSWSNPSWSNTPVSDLNYEVVNTGSTTTSYHVKVTEPPDQPPIESPVQLLINKRYETPTVLSCSPKTNPSFIPVVNVPDLRVNGRLLSDETPIDPGAADGSGRNATVTLAPGERAQITIRASLTLQQMAELARRAAPAVVPAAYKPTTLTYAQARALGGSAPVAVIGSTQTTTTLAATGPGAYTAQVLPATATGAVTFVRSGRASSRVAAITTLSGGTAAVALSPPLAAGERLTAHYGGDIQHAPSSSTTGRTTSLSFSNWVGWDNNPTTIGTRLYLAASIDPGGAICAVAGACDTVAFPDGTTAHGPTGTISFYDGARLLAGPDPVDFWDSAEYVAWLDTVLDSATWSPGVHAIRAVYSGDDVYAASEQTYLLTVLPRTPLRVTVAVGPNPATTAQQVTFTATIEGAQIPLLPGYTRVVFEQGANTPDYWAGYPLPEGFPSCLPAPGGGYTCTVSGTMTYSYGNPQLNAGTHLVRATYGGDLHYDAAASEAVALTIIPVLPQTWSAGPPSPARANTPGTAVVNGRIYVLGGAVASGGSNLPSNNVQEYDPATGTWTLRAPMPRARWGLAAVALNGRIYAFGGTATGTGGSPVLETDVYDPSTDTWSSAAPLPWAASTIYAAEAGGKIYGIASSVATPYVYDPTTDAWSLGPAIPTVRVDPGVYSTGGKIYVVGGVSFAAFPYPLIAAVEELDPATGTWTSRRPMPTARGQFAAAELGGVLYAISGHGPAWMNASYAVEAYVPSTDTWVQLPPIPRYHASPAAAGVGGRVYVISGNVGTEVDVLAP